MLNFDLRSMMLFMAVVAIALYWYVDRLQLKRRILDLTLQIKEMENATNEKWLIDEIRSSKVSIIDELKMPCLIDDSNPVLVADLLSDAGLLDEVDEIATLDLSQLSFTLSELDQFLKVNDTIAFGRVLLPNALKDRILEVERLFPKQCFVCGQ